MKSVIALCVLLLSLFQPLSCQTDWDKYEAIVSIRSTDPEELSRLITSQYQTPREKVEAIYYWITHNIAYDHKLLEKLQKDDGPKRLSTAEIQAKKKAMVTEALRKKKGVCQNYAYTFQALCKHVEIPSEFIGGWSKTDPDHPSNRGGRHAWNIVDWGEGWKFVDATYGSGYGRDGKHYFDFDPGFFATPQPEFAMNHFPQDTQWQLLDNPITEEMYESYPILGKAFLKYQLSNLAPNQHTLEVKKGEFLEINFTCPQEINQVTCINYRTKARVNVDLNREGDFYTIILNTDKLRSGSYSFWKDKEALFYFKIGVR